MIGGGDVPGDGSPPRMRGELNRLGTNQVVWGITPAYAGRTSGMLSLPMDSRDHPRVCGENHPLNEIVCGAHGSPPRMRGEPCPIV